MDDQDKTKDRTPAQFINEADRSGRLEEMRQRIAELEASAAERQRAEVERGAALELLQATIDGVNEPIMLIGADYCVKLMNQAVRDDCPMDTETGPVYCYRVSHNRDTPCSGAAHPCPLGQVRESLRPVAVVHEHVRSDGEKRFVEIIAAPLLGKDGTLTGIVESTRDITERVRAEETLREAEARFRGIFENAVIGLYRTTPDGRILMANPALVRMLGYSSFEELAQRNLEEKGYEPEYPRSVFKQRIENEGRVIGLVSAWLKRDGTTLFVRESARVIRDEAGNTLYYEGTIEDITDLKQAEETLRESEKRYKRLLESVTDYIYTVKVENGRPFSTSHGPACVAVTGYTAGEYETDPYLWYRMVHEKDRHAVTEQAARVLSGAVAPPLEHRIIHKDGSIRWVRNTPVPRYDGEGHLVAYDGLITDITERKRAEEALQESEGRFRGIIESTQAGYFCIDRDGRFQHVNDAWLQMHGYASPDEVIGQHFALTQVEADLEQAQRNVERLLSGEPIPAGEFTRRCKDGSIGYHTFSANPVVRGGAIVGLEGFLTDITERVRAEEALRQYTVELEARNEDLDAYAHTVAHDLKNPLGHIVGFAHALEGDYVALPDEELRRYLRTIAQSGRKMSNIIDELLLLATVRRMEEVKIEPLDMGGIVAEAQARLADLIEEYQAEIIIPESWPTALSYGPWVEEVWVNYMSNAIKHGGRPPRVELGFSIADLGLPILDSSSPQGIQSEIVRLSAHDEVQNQKSKIVFWVRDNGPGLTPEEQGRLFRSFEQLDQVRAKGHGLGLSIVRRIVEKLGGEVGVESQVGQGSLFWFTLPAQ